MRYLENNRDIPYYNFALEDFLLSSPGCSDSYLFFYVHRPSVIIGANQVAEAEVDMDYAESKGIIVARRMTGGGAVYHDSGNLCYSMVRPCSPDGEEHFSVFAAPVVRALRKLGADAEATGRNDITIEGRKISGTAQMVRNGKVLHHGTLLLDCDSETLGKVLTPPPEKLASKGIKSVRSRVTNIREHLADAHKEMTMADLMTAIKQSFKEEEPLEDFGLSEADNAWINGRAETHFATNEWNRLRHCEERSDEAIQL
jgi:lipoate-protein ligase A